jgi:dienelactone hydrolase
MARCSSQSMSRSPLGLTTIALLAVSLWSGSVVAAADALPIEVTSYDLGRTMVVQRDQSRESRFREMPVALQGVIAVPAGDGPYPVAVLVHGSYPFCDAAGGDQEVDVYPCPPEADRRQYEGFGYLLKALAERGYVAIAPDLSAEYNNGYAEPVFAERSLQIIDAHLDALVDGEGLPGEVAGKADLGRVALIGHSRGGSVAVRYAAHGAAAGRSVVALVLLTPAFLAPETPIPGDLPVALVIAECDGDVGTEQPLLFLDQLPPLRPALTVIETLPGGTHEAFSTRLDVQPSPGCGAQTVLPAERQQAWAAGFLPDFLDLALRGRLALSPLSD